MIDQYQYIPKQAFLFFPVEEEILQVRNKKPYRIIFDGGVELTHFEKQKLAELHEEINNEKKHHHLAYFTEATLVRFLQATKYNCSDCIKELKKYKKWEDGILPLTQKPEIMTILNKGIFYMVGRDVNYRPIIVVNVARMIELDLKEQTFQQVAGFFFQFIVQNCMIQGQVETWITIVDLGKLGMFELGGAVMDTISFLSSHFRCRLHHSYLVNCPGSITFLFGMVKKAMSQDQILKITLLEEGELPKHAFAHIFQDQIQNKYGGFHQEYEQFWPPICKQRKPSAEQRSRLLTIQQYGQMHSRGLLQKKKISKALVIQSQKLNKNVTTSSNRKNMDCSRLNADSNGNMNENQLIEDVPPHIPTIPEPINIFNLFKFVM